MNKTSLIGHLIELHDAIRKTTYPADSIVKAFFKKRHYLGSKDRRFITEAIYSLLRNFKLLDLYVDETLERTGGKRNNQGHPSIAAYAALAVKLKAEPASAALLEISGLWRVYMPDDDCATFLSALEHVNFPNTLQEKTVDGISIVHSFPESIVREWVAGFGTEETKKLCASLNTQAPTTIRVNTLRVTVEECKLALEREGIASRATLLSPVGLVLEKRINVQAVHAFKDGFFEMQDEGSQLLSLLVDPVPGTVVLDACAGGGGKSLHLAALMKNQGTLISVDVDERRLANLQQRVERAGVSIAQIHLAGRKDTDLENLKGKVDSVLIDAPCTGVGTFRRNPGAKVLFREEDVGKMAQIQRSVLETYSQFVRLGGRMVYATCSLLRKENEEAVEWFLSHHPEYGLEPAATILNNQGIMVRQSGDFLMLLPHETSTDGFFAAVLRKLS